MNEKKEFKIEKTKLLIVEGEDERRFFNSWLIELNIEDLQVLPIGGKTKLHSELKILKKLPNFSTVQSIGILRDADDDAAAAFQSVCSALENNNLTIPQKEITKTTGKPCIAVLIFPGNGLPGSLENIFLDSEKDNPIMDCVDNYFECIKEKQRALPHAIGKAKVHTFLASKIEDPDKRLGESVEAGYWNFAANSFNQIKTFITQL